MNANIAFASETGSVKVSSRQRGFTLVGTTIAFMISGIVLTGAWMSFRDMQAQMRVNAAERMMDQYAASSMQELTNDLSWAWRADKIRGGYINTRWNFMIRDEIGEQGRWSPDWNLEPNHFTQVRFQPTGGLYIGNRLPLWVEGRWGQDYYQWFGRAPRVGQVNTMDRRDRMTMESLFIDVDNTRWVTSIAERDQSPACVTIEMTLQYRYRAHALFGLYSDDYARERTYKTSVYLRNWWSRINELRDPSLGTTGAGGS